ncbi:hypothetical protein [Glycomyces sp. MUSA5-2]|uniref:hypothetical protein n=1 Tax=Glycomyces sp. MUSA5-2 TaxID=2053002 RepID=UPI003009A145
MAQDLSLYDDARTGLDVTDPEMGRLRVCAARCYSCILHRDTDKRLLESQALADYLDQVAAADEFVVCHNTGPDLGTPAAMCAGYMAEDVPDEEQEWRRSWRARMIKRHERELSVPPPAPNQSRPDVATA